MMKNPDINRFLKKSLYFFMPLVAVVSFFFTVELFVLPIDYFTFRCWEAIVVKHLREYLPGPFYPRTYINRYEEGDLGHGTPWAVSKKVEWRTDEYGYRNSGNNYSSYDIVLFGDSYAMGVGLSQDDMVSEIMKRKLRVNVYAYAMKDINDFLREKRFREHIPAFAVYIRVERGLSSLPAPTGNDDPNGSRPGVLEYVRNQIWFQTFMVLLDRVLKAPGRNYLIMKIHGKHVVPLVSQAGGPFLFFDGENVQRDETDKKIIKIVDTVAEYRDALLARGIQMIFVPAPNKESVYYKYLKNKQRPVYLEKIFNGLKKRNVNFVDLQSEFEKKSLGDKYYYQTDDTHWNADGARLAADLIMRKIKQLKNEYPNLNSP